MDNKLSHANVQCKASRKSWEWLQIVRWENYLMQTVSQAQSPALRVSMHLRYSPHRGRIDTLNAGDWALHKPCPSAFSLPVPSGGLSTRTRRLWGHRIWSPRFYDFGSFPLQSNLEDCLLKASNLLHLQLLTLRQGQVNAIRNVVENQKSPEVLKSRTSNRVSPDPPGPRAQGSRRLWGREWLHRRCIWR